MSTSAAAVPSHAIAAPPPSRRPGRLRRAIVPALVAVLAVVAAAVVFARVRSAARITPVRYETAAVDHGPIAAKVTATGSMSALVTVLVGSQVSGRIETIRADYNTRVTKGQIIATIEPSLFRATVAQARANALAATANLDRARAQEVNAARQLVRAKALFDENLLARADLDASEAAASVAKADVAAAEAQTAQAGAALAQAELNLKYTTIVSPIDGVVISRNVDVGQTVAAALQAPTLFTIAQDLAQMQVDTNVAEADIGKVREGMTATFTVDAYPGRTFQGKVRQVRDAAQTVQNVVTYDAVIDVANDDGALKPGMTASIAFVYAERGDAVRVPNAALRFKPDAATRAAMLGATAPARDLAADERAIFVVKDGHAVERAVKLGVSDGSVTEVTGGEVSPGDRVVTEATLSGEAGKKP